MSYKYIGSNRGPPNGAVAYGWQNDGGGQHWAALAYGDHGPVAGKAKDDTCWYPYDGHEQKTKDFTWLTDPLGKIFPEQNKGFPPEGAVSVGPQMFESGNYYAAVAVTKHGLIPGKAKGGTCWYPYGGKEIVTDNFLWLICQ